MLVSRRLPAIVDKPRSVSARLFVCVLHFFLPRRVVLPGEVQRGKKKCRQKGKKESLLAWLFLAPFFFFFSEL